MSLPEDTLSYLPFDCYLSYDLEGSAWKQILPSYLEPWLSSILRTEEPQIPGEKELERRKANLPGCLKSSEEVMKLQGKVDTGEDAVENSTFYTFLEAGK